MKFTLSKKKDVHLSFDGNTRVLSVNNSSLELTLAYDVTYNHLKFSLNCNLNFGGIVTFTSNDEYNYLVQAIRVCNLEIKPNTLWEPYFDLDFLKKHVVDEVTFSVRRKANLITEIQMMRNAAHAVGALGTTNVNQRRVRSI